MRFSGSLPGPQTILLFKVPGGLRFPTQRESSPRPLGSGSGYLSTPSSPAPCFDLKVPGTQGNCLASPVADSAPLCCALVSCRDVLSLHCHRACSICVSSPRCWLPSELRPPSLHRGPPAPRWSICLSGPLALCTTGVELSVFCPRLRLKSRLGRSECWAFPRSAQCPQAPARSAIAEATAHCLVNPE